MTAMYDHLYVHLCQKESLLKYFDKKKKEMQSVTGRAEFKHEYHSLGISMCAPLENHLSDHDIGFNGNHFTLQILTECLLCSMH